MIISNWRTPGSSYRKSNTFKAAVDSFGYERLDGEPERVCFLLGAEVGGRYKHLEVKMTAAEAQDFIKQLSECAEKITKDTSKLFAEYPRKEVSCPACGKIYGTGGYSVCKGCEECSKCCGCKTEGRVWVDAVTFVEGIEGKL